MEADQIKGIEILRDKLFKEAITDDEGFLKRLEAFAEETKELRSKNKTEV